MSDAEKKPFSVAQSLSSSAGVGTLITCLVNLYDTELTAKVAPVIPMVGAALTFFGVWLWNRYGCEDPKVAACRNKYERDAKMLRKLLKDPLIGPEAKAQAQREYEQTQLSLATLGRSGLADILADVDKKPEESTS